MAAPGGSGKSICGEFALLRHFLVNPEEKAVFMCPYQISCEQKHFRIAELVRNHNKVVSLLTGDSTTDVQILNKSDVIICTPTQWDMMSRRWKQRKDVQVKCCSKQ